MIPDLPNLSSPAIQADFLMPYNRGKAALVDHARGGVALLDASKGLNVKNWICEVSESGVYISSYDVAPFKVETLVGIPSWISMAFDQNMHYVLAYTLESDSNSFLYFFDSAQGAYVEYLLGRVHTPFVRMDDVRDAAQSTREVVLSYIKDNSLCVRVQRDRFGAEHVLTPSAGSKIIQCGMNKANRFQWYCV